MTPSRRNSRSYLSPPRCVVFHVIDTLSSTSSEAMEREKASSAPLLATYAEKRGVFVWAGWLVFAFLALSPVLEDDRGWRPASDHISFIRDYERFALPTILAILLVFGITETAFSLAQLVVGHVDDVGLDRPRAVERADGLRDRGEPVRVDVEEHESETLVLRILVS